MCRQPRDLSLSSQFTIGTHFLCHAGYLCRKPIELVHHLVYRVFQLEDFALCLSRNLLGKVARCHRRSHLRYVSYLCRQVGGHPVYILRKVFPCAGDAS